MGLLDDLKNQAESKKAEQQAEAERRARAEQFYREKILPRMVKAYQYINQFIDHLKVLEHETIVEYPILPQGKKQPFTQGGYMVVIDSSKNLKKIDFTMECTLEVPVQFELFGKEVVLSHADRISQYSIKHDRKDRKGPSMEIESAKFTVIGPMPLRVSLIADVDEGNIKLTIRNFIDPGFQHYTLKLEQFNDEFLDRLGHFVLRQDMNLFGKQEISEQQKKKIRDRMLVENKLRQEELREAEERARAEAEAEAANTKKEQLKRAVNTTVSQGKENLKGMFKKIKQTASQIAESQLKATNKTPSQQAAPVQRQPKQSKPEQLKPEPSRPVTPKATNPAQVKPKASTAHQASAATQVPPAQASGKPNQAAPTRKAASTVKKTRTPEPEATLQAKLASQLKSTVKQPKHAPQAEAKNSAAPVKKSESPRIYQASSDNPFLTPEDMLTPEQIKEQAEKEKRLKEQTRAEMIAEKARANVEAKQSVEPGVNTQTNDQAVSNETPTDNTDKIGPVRVESKSSVTQVSSERKPVENKNEANPAKKKGKSHSLSLEDPADRNAAKPVASETVNAQKAPNAVDNVLQKGIGLSLEGEQKPKKTKSEKTKQEKAKQEKAQQEKAQQEKAQQEKAKQEKAKQEKAKQEKAKQEKAKQEKAKLEKAKQEKAKQEKAKQEKAQQEKAQQEKIKPEKIRTDSSQVTTKPVGLAPELDADGMPLASPDEVMDYDLNDLSALSDVEQVELESVETGLKSEKSDSDSIKKSKNLFETNSAGSLKEAWQKSKSEDRHETQREIKNTEQKEQLSVAPESDSLEPGTVAPEVVPDEVPIPVDDGISSQSQQQEGLDVPSPTPAAESKTEPAVVEDKADPAPSILSFEDELERDLANIIENEHQNKTAQKADDSDTPDKKLKIDLSAPDELEIDFDNQAGAAGSLSSSKDPETKK